MAIIRKTRTIMPVFGLLLFTWLLYSIGPGNIANVFTTVKPLYLLLALTFSLLYFVLQTLKWGYILKKQGIRLSFSYIISAYFRGSLWGLITPGRVGTFIRVKYLKSKTNRDFGKCCSSVVTDKVMDIFTIFVFAVLGTVFIVRSMGTSLTFIITTFFVLFILTIVLIVRKEVSSGTMKILYRLLVPADMKTDARKAFYSFYDSLPSFRELIYPFLLSLTAWIFTYSANYVIALSLGIEIPYFVFITIYPIATIIGLIPITVGGWGTREAVLISILALFDVPMESVVALSISCFLVNSLALSIAGTLISKTLQSDV